MPQFVCFQVSTYEIPPSTLYYRADNGSLLYRYGEDIAITELLAYVLNFTVHYAEPADGITNYLSLYYSYIVFIDLVKCDVITNTWLLSLSWNPSLIICLDLHQYFARNSCHYFSS